MNRKLQDGIATIAVAKALTKDQLKDARDAIEPGEFEVDVTVRVHGTVKIGLPFSQTFVSAVPWETIAKACFDRLNRASQQRVLDDVLDAWQGGQLEDLREEVDERISEETWAIFQGLKDRTEKAVNGKVTPRLAVDWVA